MKREDFRNKNITGQIALSITLAFFIVLFLNVKFTVIPYSIDEGYEPDTVYIYPSKDRLPDLPPEPQKVKKYKKKGYGDLIPEEKGGKEKEKEDPIIVSDSEINYNTFIPQPKLPWEVQEPPVILRKIAPEYPDIARSLNLEGNVYVYLIVYPDSTFKIEKIIADNKIFIESVKEVLENFKFRPGYQAGRPVAVRIIVPFTFKLKE